MPNPMSRRFMSVSSAKSFIVLALTFKPSGLIFKVHFSIFRKEGIGRNSH